MIMKNLIQKLLIICFFLTSFSAQAEVSWYKVEVIVFANLDESTIDDEKWQPITEVPQRKSVALKAPSAEQTVPYSLIPRSQLNLTSDKQHLSRSGKYKILYHSGWVQPVTETQKPFPVRITAGEIMDNGMYELDGYVAVGRGRYLHFRPDLYFSRKVQKAPAMPEALPVDTNASAALPALQFPELPEILTVNLNQARRMRSEELHYIDHPLFGVMVEILPMDK